MSMTTSRGWALVIDELGGRALHGARGAGGPALRAFTRSTARR
jgi:hypothetical protein